MARKVISEDSSSVAEETLPVKETSSVAVLRKDGEVMRVYTKAEHGAEFKKLAEMYADKNGYSLR